MLLAALEGVPYLLCALGDGQLLNFRIDPASGALSERKKLALGTKPAELRAFRSRCAPGVSPALHALAADRVHAETNKVLPKRPQLADIMPLAELRAFPLTGPLTLPQLRALRAPGVRLSQHAPLAWVCDLLPHPDAPWSLSSSRSILPQPEHQLGLGSEVALTACMFMRG